MIWQFPQDRVHSMVTDMNIHIRNLETYTQSIKKQIIEAQSRVDAELALTQQTMQDMRGASKKTPFERQRLIRLPCFDAEVLSFVILKIIFVIERRWIHCTTQSQTGSITISGFSNHQGTCLFCLFVLIHL